MTIGRVERKGAAAKCQLCVAFFQKDKTQERKWVSVRGDV